MTVATEHLALLNQWDQAQAQLKALKAQEMELRKKVVETFFSRPEIGKNKAPLNSGYNLELDYKIGFEFDFDAFTEACFEPDGVELKIEPDDVVVYKPNFNESLYKKLPADKKVFVDQFLTTKPAAPTLKIVKGKT